MLDPDNTQYLNALRFKAFNTPTQAAARTPPSRFALYGHGLFLAAAYFAARWLSSLLLAADYAAFSPAAGLALSALLLRGAHYWPAIALGALTFELATHSQADASLAIIAAAGATLQAVVGALLVLRHTRGSLLLARERDIAGFYLLGGVLAHTANASLQAGAAFLTQNAAWSECMELWWTTWLGDALGATIITPLALAWLSSKQEWASRRDVLTLPILTMFAATSAVFFYAQHIESSLSADSRMSIALLALGGGLLFTACIGAATLMITGRSLSIETLVGQRTQELARINETLAEEICDHLNTEYALDKERESLNAVLNNMHEGILAFDDGGRLRIINGAALRMHRQITGVDLDAAGEPSLFNLYEADGVTPIAADRMPQVVALRGESVDELEMVAQANDRPALNFSVNAQPLYTTDGKQHGAIVVVRDITETRKIERMKSEFVATVSHELRTPITSIRGSLGLIAGGAAGALTDKSKQLVDIALRNSDRLAMLINDLLDIEKIESGKMHFDFQEHVLGDLIAQAIEAHGGYAQTYNVRLAVAQPLPAVCVRVDAHRWLQVMANLMSNAAKFSPKGESVEVSAVLSGDAVRVQVRDRGPGVPEEFRARLFQKFSQADSSDARARSGTGLGLAICKSIVERMGGVIGYQTELGVGTTFYFDLPLARTSTPVVSQA